MSETEDTISMHMNNKSIWNVVNILGQDVPFEMAVRELVQNAFEACGRHETDLPKYVRVNKNAQGNLTITNRGGDFFSLDAAKEHLNTLGNSGNSRNMTDNFGIGAKISVLANNHEICYTSKKENQKNGHTFTIGSISPDVYGLKNMKSSCFSSKDFTNSVTSASIVSEDGNSWNKLNGVISSGKAVSGWNIAGLLSNRYFRTPEKLEVATYNKKGKIKYVGIKGTLHCMKVTKNYGVIDLVGKNIPKGTKAHWCVLSEKKSNRNRLLKDYFMGFSLKNEILTNLYDSFQSRTVDFTKCGILSGANRIVVIFELPEDSGFVWNGARNNILSRDSKKTLKKEDFYIAFKEQIPEKIRKLQKEEEYELDLDKIQKELMKELKDFFMPSHGSPCSKGGKRKADSEDPPLPRPRSRGNNFKFSLNKLPFLKDSDNEDAPAISYLAESNTIVINHQSPVFKYRRDVIVKNGDKDYSPLSEKVITGNIRTEMYRGAVYSMAEFFMIKGKNYTPEEIEEFLTPDRLDVWGAPQTRNVRVKLGHPLTRLLASII